MRTGNGPVPAQVMIVGDWFSRDDEVAGEPFMGSSGQELNRMLHEVGILRSTCFVSNLVNQQPDYRELSSWLPEKKKEVTHAHTPLRDRMVAPIVKEGFQRLLREIKEVEPNLIITCGNAPLWALTGAWGALKWRGSLLRMVPPNDLFDTWPDERLPKVIPIVHPSAVMRQWELRATTIIDLKRAKKHMLSRELVYPKWNFIIRPSFEKVMEILALLEDKMEEGPLDLTLDLETRAGHISCCGLAWSKLDAISIPFMLRGQMDGYWSEDEETFIIYRLYKLLTNHNCRLIGQNLLYDLQYIYRHWHFIVLNVFDTMIAHHTAFAGLQKALDFQASMYCDFFVQWKPEKATWKTGG